MNPILFIYLVTCFISFLAIFKFFRECINILEEQKYELDEEKLVEKERTTISLPWWLIIIGFSSMPIFNIMSASLFIVRHDEMIDMVINAMNQYKK